MIKELPKECPIKSAKLHICTGNVNVKANVAIIIINFTYTHMDSRNNNDARNNNDTLGEITDEQMNDASMQQLAAGGLLLSNNPGAGMTRTSQEQQQQQMMIRAGSQQSANSARDSRQRRAMDQ